MLRAGFENRVKPPRAKAPDTSAPAATDVVSQFANRNAATPALPNRTDTATAKQTNPAGDQQTLNATTNIGGNTPQAPVGTPATPDFAQTNPLAAYAPNGPGEGGYAPQTATPAPAEPPAAAAGPAQAPTVSPSGFVGFDQYFGANAGAAKNQAAQFQSKLKGQAGAAQNALAQQYGQWRDAQSQSRPSTFAASQDVQGAFAKAIDTRNAGQSVEGLQGAQGGSALDAGLTYESGVDTSPYAGLDTAIGETEKRAADVRKGMDNAAAARKADARARQEAAAHQRDAAARAAEQKAVDDQLAAINRGSPDEMDEIAPQSSDATEWASAREVKEPTAKRRSNEKEK